MANRKSTTVGIGYVTECARPIPGFETYWVSASGDVFSLRQKWTKKGLAVLLSPEIDRDGYKAVHVRNSKGMKRIYVHRLVAFTWVNSSPWSGLVVNHKDGDRQNNYYKNLEWVTPAQSERHAWLNGKEKLINRTAKGVFCK